MKEGGIRASFSKASGQRKLRKSENEEKVLRRITNLMCIVKKMSKIGRGGKGPRWRISEQLTDLSMQGWMNDEYEPALGELEVWST